MLKSKIINNLYFFQEILKNIKLISILYFKPKIALNDLETLKQVENKLNDLDIKKGLDVIYEWRNKMPQENNQIIVDEKNKACFK